MEISRKHSSLTLYTRMRSLLDLIISSRSQDLCDWNIDQLNSPQIEKLNAIKTRVCEPYRRFLEHELCGEAAAELELFYSQLEKRFNLKRENDDKIDLATVDLDCYLDFMDFKKRYTLTDLYNPSNDMLGRFLFNHSLHLFFNVMLTRNYLENLVSQNDQYAVIFKQLLETKDIDFFKASYPSDFFVFCREESAVSIPAPRHLIMNESKFSCFTSNSLDMKIPPNSVIFSLN